MQEPKEVFDVIFPPGDEAAEVVQPCEQPFHLPASAVTTQFAALLALAPVAPIGRDQLDPVLLGECGIERVRVVGFVANEPGREFVEETAGQTYSTSWHSAGEALSTDTARGRLLPAAIAMIFVPLPRRVGPSAKPPFWRSRKWHQRTPLPSSAFLARAGAGQAVSAPAPVCRCAPTAESDDGMSDRADISPASPAIALRFPTPRALRSKQHECHATAGRDYPHAEPGGASAPLSPTVHPSVPNVQSMALRGYLRAPTESHEIAPELFMRLVLVSYRNRLESSSSLPLAYCSRRFRSRLATTRPSGSSDVVGERIGELPLV